MAHDVFISHSNSDRTVANAVCAMLEQAGIRCWMAPRDIIPGKSWGGEIVRAISETKIMVLIFSGEANRSQQILREVERAVGHRVVILPFKVEDVVPAEDLEYFISSQHWLDAVTPPLEQHIDYLARTVRRVLEDSGRTVQPPDQPGRKPDPPPPIQRPPGHRAGDGPHDGPSSKSTDPGTISALLHDTGHRIPPTIKSDPPISAGGAGGVGDVRRDEPKKPWLIPAVVGGGLLVLVLGWFMLSGGDDNGTTNPSGVSTSGTVESELAAIDSERQAAETRKNDTDARAYMAADSILGAALTRLAAVQAGEVPAAMQARVAQMDSTLKASRAAISAACWSERSVLGTTTTECPGGQR